MCVCVLKAYLLLPLTRAGPQSTPQGAFQTQLDPSLEIEFVEKPSEEVFCPILQIPLLKPHLTTCCGQHISETSAERIKPEGKACPLCNNPEWDTVLNKHFQRTVCELQVYCPHRRGGCGWKGELRSLSSHEQSCSKKTSPLETKSKVSKTEQVCFMSVTHSL